MGCDYKVYTCLHVTYKKGDENCFQRIDLDRKRHYFYEYTGSADSDEEDYNLILSNFYNNQINKHYKEIEIFRNNDYVLPLHKYKYEHIIRSRLGKNITLVKVIKIRYGN